MIPALIVPVLNRYDLLDQMLQSIDHPVHQIVVVDNGGGSLRGGCPEAVVDRDHVSYIRLPHNIGVAASWNLGVKVTPTAPWWLIANSDLTFGPGDLEALEAGVDPYRPVLYFMLGMAAFAVTAPALQVVVGLFDENFHPAYNEDLDWQRRARLAGVPLEQLRFTGTHVGSATIMADPVLRAVNGRTHQANDLYYARKWGGPKQGGEMFASPFNRGGPVSEWVLDPERLSRQAWPDR